MAVSTLISPNWENVLNTIVQGDVINGFEAELQPFFRALPKHDTMVLEFILDAKLHYAPEEESISGGTVHFKFSNEQLQIFEKRVLFLHSLPGNNWNDKWNQFLASRDRIKSLTADGNATTLPTTPSKPSVIISTDPTRIIILSSIYRILHILRSMLLFGTTDLSGNTNNSEIQKDITPTACGELGMEALDVLTAPHQKISELHSANHEKFLADCTLTIILISAADTRTTLMKDLANCVSQITSLNVVFLFERKITTVELRVLLQVISSCISLRFAYVSGVVFDAPSTKLLLKQFIIHSEDLSIVKDIKFVSPPLVETSPIEELTSINNSVVVQQHRDRCKALLRAELEARGKALQVGTGKPISSESEAEEDQACPSTVLSTTNIVNGSELMECDHLSEKAKEFEEKIFSATKGNLQEYISTFCHQKIRIQNLDSSFFTEIDSSFLTKIDSSLLTKRSVDKFLEYAEVPVDSNWKIDTPSYQWYYSVPACEEVIAIQHDKSIPKVMEVPKEEGELEKRFQSKDAKPIHKKLKGFNGEEVAIRVNDFSITYRGKTLKALKRETRYAGSSLMIPPFWSDHQEKMIQETILNLNSPECQSFIEEIKLINPRAEIAQITKIQNFQHLQNFNLEMNAIAMNFPSLPAEGPSPGPTFLYYGSYKILPKSIIEDNEGIPCDNIDPDPNQNWGSGIHLSSNIQYADERAYSICDEKRENHLKQIFVVSAVLGKATECLCDDTLRRPPTRDMLNHMPIFYDSITGKYKTEHFEADVNIVYKSGQVLPSFLIDYTVPVE